MSLIEKNLSAHGIVLPEPVAPVANYVPFVITGNLVMISGQVSIGADGLMTGKVGNDLSLEEGVKAAEACAVNLLAQLKAACDGNLDRAVRCIRLGGFVNCGPEFTDHPKVINGASDLMVHAMGSAGKHARAAVGSSSLPLGAAVEVDGIFEIA
ncbi:RidA family protein [Parvularcula sp. IMCC14364]|uniref:RidA family protein n=1 Tax=Parvularcula sp. IMCC14364 TaxID=3067902 RepID=UPI0027420D5F|nr:RidA family protein [Parvularcula sp. IMCC14364]